MTFNPVGNEVMSLDSPALSWGHWDGQLSPALALALLLCERAGIVTRDG